MKKTIVRIIAALAVVAALIPACMKITAIIIPDNVQANQDVEIHVKGELNPETDYTNHLVLAVCAPVSLNLRENAKIYLTTSGLTGSDGGPELVDELMEYIPDTDPSKYGVWSTMLFDRYGNLGNVGGDVEWLAFQSASVRSAKEKSNILLDAKVVFNTGEENIKCTLGFEYISMQDIFDDVGYKQNMTTSLFVIGDGSVDYTTLPLTKTVPSKFRFGDFFSVSFSSMAGDQKTALYDMEKVYMLGTAVLEDGTEVTRNVIDAGTLMKRNDKTSYSKYVFPVDYFKLPKGTKISQVFFYFTNYDGSITVTPDTEPRGFEFKQCAD